MQAANENHPNNLRFAELLRSTNLKVVTAMTLFNRGMKPSVSTTLFTGWLASPGTEKWSPVSDEHLAHAETVFVPMALGFGR